MATQRPFVVNPVLTAMAMGYKNGMMIADSVMPRVTVGSELYKYTQYGKEDFLPTDDRVGRTGRVNEVEYGATPKTASVNDHGLEAPIPQSDIDMAAKQPGFDPKGNATKKLAKQIVLNREIRTAAIVFGAATYPAGSKATVTGTDQWGSAGGKPIDQVMDARDGMLITPNTFVLGKLTASRLRRNPQIVKAYNGSLGDEGLVPMDYIRELFGFQRVLVGEAWSNAANKGQTESLGAIWGNHAAMLYIDEAVTDPDEITFAITAQLGDRVAKEMMDENIGLRGGVRIRVGESVNEQVIAADVGYFFENAGGDGT